MAAVPGGCRPRTSSQASSGQEECTGPERGWPCGATQHTAALPTGLPVPGLSAHPEGRLWGSRRWGWGWGAEPPEGCARWADRMGRIAIVLLALPRPGSPQGKGARGLAPKQALGWEQRQGPRSPLQAGVQTHTEAECAKHVPSLLESKAGSVHDPSPSFPNADADVPTLSDITPVTGLQQEPESNENTAPKLAPLESMPNLKFK